MHQSTAALAEATPNKADRLLRLRDVMYMTGLSRTTSYETMQRPAGEGGFPRPVKVRSISAWPESEVREWIAARKH